MSRHVVFKLVFKDQKAFFSKWTFTNAVTPFELLDRDHEPRQFLNTVWQNKDHVLHSDIAALFHISKGSENIPDEKITAVLAILGKEIQETVDRLREGVANHVSVF